jgi:hypothetical protein
MALDVGEGACLKKEKDSSFSENGTIIGIIIVGIDQCFIYTYYMPGNVLVLSEY